MPRKRRSKAKAKPKAKTLSDASMLMQTDQDTRAVLLAKIFESAPDLADELDKARGPCSKFQGTHPSNRRCKKRRKKVPSAPFYMFRKARS